MELDYKMLGSRIQKLRNQAHLTQEEMAAKLNLSREQISFIERGLRTPSIDTLVDLANTLGISADDLLVDSLEHSSSTADTELHQLLLDCNEVEEKVLVELVKYMKAVLYSQGI